MKRNPSSYWKFTVKCWVPNPIPELISEGTINPWMLLLRNRYIKKKTIHSTNIPQYHHVWYSCWYYSIALFCHIQTWQLLFCHFAPHPIKNLQFCKQEASVHDLRYSFPEYKRVSDKTYRQLPLLVMENNVFSKKKKCRKGQYYGWFSGKAFKFVSKLV